MLQHGLMMKTRLINSSGSRYDLLHLLSNVPSVVNIFLENISRPTANYMTLVLNAEEPPRLYVQPVTDDVVTYLLSDRQQEEPRCG